MVEGSARLLGWFAGDRNDRDDLLGAEGGRLARPGGVVEKVLQDLTELGWGQVLFGRKEGGRGLPPAVAPGTDGDASQAQLPSDGFDTGRDQQGQHDSGPTDQTLVGGLLSLNPLQKSLLGCRDLDRGCSWSSHRLVPSKRPP